MTPKAVRMEAASAPASPACRLQQTKSKPAIRVGYRVLLKGTVSEWKQPLYLHHQPAGYSKQSQNLQSG